MVPAKAVVRRGQAVLEGGSQALLDITVAGASLLPLLPGGVSIEVAARELAAALNEMISAPSSESAWCAWIQVTTGQPGSGCPQPQPGPIRIPNPVQPGPVRAPLIITGLTCTLPEAITSANTDTAVGGCPAGSGVDTIVMPGISQELTEINNNSPQYDNSPQYGPSGLPVISSPIIDSNGSVISRAPTAPPFRIFAVGPNGDLLLEETTVSGGVASALPNIPYSGNGGGLFSYGGNIPWLTVMPLVIRRQLKAVGSILATVICILLTIPTQKVCHSRRRHIKLRRCPGYNTCLGLR